MLRSSRVVLVLLAAGAAAVAQNAAAPLSFDYPALLRRLVDVDWLWQPPVPGERCVQWSSYDRASHKGPGDHGAWYANNDRGQHLRVDERGGVKEHVMVDAKGPGCLARIWSANPSGTLHVDVDGARVWSVDFLALCSGKVEGVPEPLAGMRAKGGNCYLPIPFAKSLVVSCTAGDCYYAFDVVQWPAGTEVPSFAPPALAKAPMEKVRTGLWIPRTGGKLEPWLNDDAVVDGRVVTRVPIAAGSVVECLYLRTNAPLDVLQRTMLRAGCGEEVLVDVPVLAFFGCEAGWQRWGGARFGVFGPPESMAMCSFPMPYPRAGWIELSTEGDRGDATLVLAGNVARPEGGVPPDALLFRANYHVVKGTKTRPFSDHLVLDAKGRGRFVGCSLLVRNPSRVWWGEGDEKFTVDGEAFPSWFGTGTEDYFGYAWCDPTPFQAPFHAQVECQGPMNFGFTQLHRTHVLDAVPFQSSFRFDLERWHWVEDCEVDYATVAYWYGAPGATSGLPAVPPAKERLLERLPAPPMLVVEGALEGEALRVVSCSGGRHEVQSMWFVEKMFSHDGQLWWRDPKVGDVLVLAVPVPEAGRYKLAAAFCQADDYGTFDVSIAGQSLGTFDGYSPRIATTGARELGTVELKAGDAELRFVVRGRDERAKPHHMLGLDYVKLEKLP